MISPALSRRLAIAMQFPPLSALAPDERYLLAKAVREAKSMKDVPAQYLTAIQAALEASRGKPGEKGLCLTLTKAAVNGRHVPGTPYEWRHGWEPLTAEVARRHGKPSPVPPGSARDPLHVLDGSRDYIEAPATWQRSGDPEVRAATIWSDSYGGLNAIRETIRNRRAGRDPLAGVDVASDPWLRRYTHVTVYDEAMTRPYSEKDLKNDVAHAADVISAKVAAAPRHDGPLWRGMVVADPNLFQVGDEFEQDVASWTGNQDIARVYATPRPVPGKPLDPTLIHPVTIVGRGMHAYDISAASVGNTQGGSELLAGGRYRVTQVAQENDHTMVTVEEVR